MLTNKRIVVTGGTGSIGNVLVRRLLSGELGMPAEVVIFSRDEAKQYAMRLALERREVANDDVVYEQRRRVRFQIGDVSDYRALCTVLRDADVVFNAAALKQVPACEYFPFEAVRTNVCGPENIVRAIREHSYKVETVVGISTDKACKPVNVMGMTKALQERIFIQANLDCPSTRFVITRYGNVLASRGSVIPLFHEQIRSGGPVTLTAPGMTRFLMSLDQAVDTIFAAVEHGNPGETFIPRVPAARMVDVASALIGDRPIETIYTGVRPGEKTDETLISEEESPRSVERGDYYVILPALPQLRERIVGAPFPDREYRSCDDLLQPDEVGELLREHRLHVDDHPTFQNAFAVPVGSGQTNGHNGHVTRET